MTLSRCPWCQGSEPSMTTYHDTEWGVPVHEDHTHFEYLLLESAQAGLSWRTILQKREGYRRAFAGFDPAAVARYTEADQQRLLGDPGIIRHRAKIASAITNARAFLRVQEAYGSFDQYIWRFVEGRPMQRQWEEESAIPAVSPESTTMSRELKRQGFSFLGPTTCYAYMQAVGMVNDHLLRCYRHAEVAALGG